MAGLLTTRSNRTLALASMLVAVLATAVGCAAPLTGPVSKSFDVEPFATQPRIDVQWRKTVDRAAIAELNSKQFAPPRLAQKGDRWDLYVGTDSGDLYKYRAGDGTERWRRRLDGPVHASPAVDDDRLYVGTLHGRLYALEQSSGKTAWQRTFDRGIESEPAVADGRVFATTNKGHLIAVDASSGETLWRYERSTPEEFTVKGSGTPVVDQETVYCGFADGILAALDVTSGDVRWTSDLSQGKEQFTDVDAPVIVRENRIYALSYGVGAYALERKTGEPVWQRAIENAAAHAFREGSIYVAVATGRIVSLDADRGRPEWTFELETYLPVDLSIAGPYVFVSTGEGPLYTLDRETGYPFSTWRPSNGFSTPVVFSSRAGYLFSNRGYVYGLRLAY